MNLVKVLKAKSKRYGEVLATKELMTRYVLIDPMLKELGWDLTDPDTVTMEEPTSGNKRVDYKMGRTMVIEAKNGSTTPNKGMVEKYLNDFDVQYGIVTNGIQWNVYVKERASPEFAFSLNDDPKTIISNVINLHRIIASEGIDEAEQDVSPTETGINLTQEVAPRGDIPLAEIPYPSKRHPARLYFPDASSIVLNKWIDILAGVAEWLVDKEHLSAIQCPIQYTPKSTIINTQKKHKNGIPFKSGKRVCQLYINSNLSQVSVRQYTIKLLNTLGLDSSKFYVRFDE